MAPRQRPSQNQTDRPKSASDEPRLFIASRLPTPVIDQLGHLIDDLSARDLPVRWTAASGLHLTFHFIGEVAQERAELLRMAFANLAPRMGSIRLRTGGLGTFPNQRRPRVLWVGLEGETQKLIAVRNDLGALLMRQGFEIDRTGFKPHVTLGRARDTVDKLFPYQLAEAFESPSVREIVDSPVEFSLSDVVLFRSHLERSGARYEELASVRL